jgi:hypothetical protein
VTSTNVVVHEGMIRLDDLCEDQEDSADEGVHPLSSDDDDEEILSNSENSPARKAADEHDDPSSSDDDDEEMPSDEDSADDPAHVAANEVDPAQVAANEADPAQTTSDVAPNRVRARCPHRVRFARGDATEEEEVAAPRWSDRQCKAPSEWWVPSANVEKRVKAISSIGKRDDNSTLDCQKYYEKASYIVGVDMKYIGTVVLAYLMNDTMHLAGHYSTEIRRYIANIAKYCDPDALYGVSMTVWVHAWRLHSMLMWHVCEWTAQTNYRQTCDCY